MPIKDGSSNVDVVRWLKDLTWNEAHLAFMGFYAGFVAPQPKKKHEPSEHYKQMLNWETNRWYYEQSYVGGYAFKVLLGTGGLTALELMNVINLLPA